MACPPSASASDNVTANVTVLQSDDLAGIDETLAAAREDTERAAAAMEEMVAIFDFLAEMVLMFVLVALALWKHRSAYIKFIAMLATFFIPLRWLDEYFIISLILFLFTGYFFFVSVITIFLSKGKLSDKLLQILKKAASAEDDGGDEDEV